jgi:hypothetical protein
MGKLNRNNNFKVINMKTIKTAIYFFLLLFLMSCNSKDKIIGEWERYGDFGSGGLVKIEKFGDSYQGSKMNLVGNDENYGWQIGDVCWKNITPIETNKYKASGVAKGFDYGRQIIKEADVILVIENENTLLVKDFVTDKTIEGEGKERRFKRIE